MAWLHEDGSLPANLKICDHFDPPHNGDFNICEHTREIREIYLKKKQQAEEEAQQPIFRSEATGIKHQEQLEDEEQSEDSSDEESKFTIDGHDPKGLFLQHGSKIIDLSNVKSEAEYEQILTTICGLDIVSLPE